MTEFLLFTLYAPLASWGDIAVGEQRGSWDRPSRSAVLGLLGAALGVDREAQAEHDSLHADYAVAVRLEAPGSALVDFHTAQTVSVARAARRRAGTRAALLEGRELETILSRRTYRQNALATAAVWTVGTPRWPLAEIQAAMRNPSFVLYAGRKSNPFGLPLAPELIAAPSVAEALVQRARHRGVTDDAPPQARAAIAALFEHLRPARGWGLEVSLEADTAVPTGLRPERRRETRRDTAPHRGRWHFSERLVEIGVLPESGSGEVTHE